jgi:hypothetical protein
MKRLLIALCCIAGISTATRTRGVPPDGIDNVVAFARLYGVVRYFYPADAAVAVDWLGFAVLGVSRVRPAGDAAALGTALERLFATLGPGIAIGPSLPPAPAIGAPDDSLVAWRYLGAAVGRRPGVYRAARTNRRPGATTGPSDARSGVEVVTSSTVPVTGDHVDVDLGRGLRARVSLTLSSEDAARRPDAAALSGLLAAASRMLPARDAHPDTNLADVVVAWNVFRHFYPYWPDLTRDPHVDWDERLAGHLRAAAAATTRAQQREVLQLLVADAHDGHGGVTDPSAAATRGALPIQARPIEGRIVVIASDAPAVPVGAVVTAVDRRPARRWLDDRVRLKSGSAQWKTELVLRVMECEQGTTVEVTLDDGGGRLRSVPLVCGTRRAKPLPERRPEPLAELSPGLWYVDLTRATYQQVVPALPRLAEARGVVFDVRGYPTDAGASILPHLLDAPERDRWMHVDRITGPFGRVGGVFDIGWNVQPRTPAIAGRRVFLTDGRAISYAESVMGYVADRKLGTIVGAPTAGTNGNVVLFDLPGGCEIAFTGMRVTRHDGTTRRHLIGIAPDVPLDPTIDGIRRGRDELLEKAVALIDRPPSAGTPSK